MSVDDLLPSEIWYQILTKLPVKSILQSRSVCKKWYSLISSPDFITYHAAQTLNHSTTNRVLVRSRHRHRDGFSFYDESFVESHEHDDVSEQFYYGDVQIVGSCNGLVCLLVEDEIFEGMNDIEVHRFLIWNPSIRILVELPLLLLPPEHDPEEAFGNLSYLLRFGIDSDSGDYKVLRIGYFSRGPKFGVLVVSEIFDQRMDVWRAISPPMAPRNVLDPKSCNLYGFLHWIGSEDQRNHVLVSFNLSSEVSQKMVMPDGIVFEDYNDSVLVNNGLLSVALLTTQLQGDDIQYYCTVWSMKEYGVTESWTKLFNIELPYTLNRKGLLRFWENGEVVIARFLSGNTMVVYNPQNRTSKALFSPNQYVSDVCFYKESLVLL